VTTEEEGTARKLKRDKIVKIARLSVVKTLRVVDIIQLLHLFCYAYQTLCHSYKRITTRS